jgi:hypothetical protein
MAVLVVQNLSALLDFQTALARIFHQMKMSTNAIRQYLVLGLPTLQEIALQIHLFRIQF